MHWHGSMWPSCLMRQHLQCARQPPHMGLGRLSSSCAKFVAKACLLPSVHPLRYIIMEGGRARMCASRRCRGQSAKSRGHRGHAAACCAVARIGGRVQHGKAVHALACASLRSEAAELAARPAPSRKRCLDKIGEFSPKLLVLLGEDVEVEQWPRLGCGNPLHVRDPRNESVAQHELGRTAHSGTPSRQTASHSARVS